MKVEIVTTGDEVVNGVIVDTNSAWIAEKCVGLGHEVVRHTSVADDKNAIGNALLSATGTANAVIVSGGLGQTADDITIAAAVGAFGRDFVKEAILQNKVGTAPGVQVKFNDAEFFFLPGVPKELYQIFDDFVLPWLNARAELKVSEKVLRCFGMPEAEIDKKIAGVNFFGTRLSFRVKYPEVLLKVAARASSFSEAKAQTDKAAAAIKERLSDVIYGEGSATLPEVVGHLLLERKMTIAVAESCTGGLVSDEITNIPGSSAYFDRGIAAYSNASKREVLGVKDETLRAYGAVSRETAIAMAEGVKRISKAAIGVGVTGIAGPGGGTPEKPVGTVHIAIAAPEGTNAHEYHFKRDRVWFKKIAAWTAIDMVRKYLT